MKKIVASIFCLIFLTACSGLAAAPPTQTPACTPPACAVNESYACAGDCPGGCGTYCLKNTPDPSIDLVNYFPLAVGNIWVYSGQVGYQGDGQTANTVDIEYRMEVLKQAAAGDVRAYLMLGHPLDLAFSDGYPTPSEYTIIQVGQTAFYRAGPEAFNLVKAGNSNLEDLARDDQIFLDTPLMVGKKFCEPAMMTSNFGYCWVVVEEKVIALNKVTNLTLKQPLTSYQLVYSTNPDVQVVGFVPGIGIVSYYYNHSGSFSQVEIQLTAFYPGQP